LIGVIVPRKIAAGVEPVHDVSILLGVGRHLGSQAREDLDHNHAGAPYTARGVGR
jgi:hypothetical protein